MNAQTKIQASLPDLLRNAREAAREYEAADALVDRWPFPSQGYVQASIDAEMADLRAMRTSKDLIDTLMARTGLTLPELREIYERFL